MKEKIKMNVKIKVTMKILWIEDQSNDTEEEFFQEEIQKIKRDVNTVY